ncbi:B-cell lymphoma 3 protein homolog [Hyperolius riggenbachi]|uniref:B-cell lymphoma 3 protein homolog n=1 Tax=Hyperolius riggenbachi TaxID=752182 RepID=UPI0035A34ED7
MDTYPYHQAGGMEAALPLDLSIRSSMLDEMSRTSAGFWGKGAAKPPRGVKVENAKLPAGGHSETLVEAGLHKDQACLPLRKRRFPPSPKEERPPAKWTAEDCQLAKQYCSNYYEIPVTPVATYYQGDPAPYIQSYPAHPIMSPQPLRILPAFPASQLHASLDLHADIAAATRPDEDGDTALHIAVVHGNIAAVRRVIALLNHGRIDLDIMNNLRQTPLHLAVITDQPALAALLVENRSSPSIQDRHGQTCVHLACEYESICCLEVLLRDGTRDLEATNYQGMTALHIAVDTGRKDLILCLLKHGADVNTVDIKSGQSPLIQAVQNGDEELVSLLIQHGAQVNQLTYAGNTALHVASGRGLAEITRILLKSGADSSIKNCHNDTALTVAKDRKIVDILKGKSSSPRAQNERFKGESTEHAITPPNYRMVSPHASSVSPPP